MKFKSVLSFMILAIAALNAQEAGTSKDAAPPAVKEEPAKPTFKQPYRFEYTLTELNGKQRINTRKFDILTNLRGEVRTGSRVPVPTGIVGGSTQYEYVNPGLRAEMVCHPRTDGDIELHVEVNMEFFVMSEATPASSQSSHTVTRNIRIEVDSQVKPGVPTVLGTVEDVASTHSYELSVTASPR